MERFTGKDGREWVRMPTDDYWQRITEANSDVAAARVAGYNDGYKAGHNDLAENEGLMPMPEPATKPVDGAG